MKDWPRLAAVLLEALGDQVAERGYPAWVRILDPPDGDPDEGFALDLSGESEDLLGWVATPDCQAVGLVATGRLRSISGGPAPGGATEEPGDAGDTGDGRNATGAEDATDSTAGHLRMACLVTREGEVAWKTELPAGVSGAAMPREAPTEGRLLDCLRRCFGLPTPPPPVSPARLQAIAWLVAIFDRTVTAHGRLTWFEVSRLHPVAQILNAGVGGPADGLLPGLSRVAGSAWSWEDFRRQAEREEDGLGHIVDPYLAGWMDQGMFARWVLSELPSPDELLAQVRPHLVPSAARRLAHAVHESGLAEAADAAT